MILFGPHPRHSTPRDILQRKYRRQMALVSAGLRVMSDNHVKDWLHSWCQFGMDDADDGTLDTLIKVLNDMRDLREQAEDIIKTAKVDLGEAVEELMPAVGRLERVHDAFKEIVDHYCSQDLQQCRNAKTLLYQTCEL